MKSLIISLPRAVLNSVVFLILLPRGRNGCACTQGCNPHGRFAAVMTFSDLHCRFVGVLKLVVPSVDECGLNTCWKIICQSWAS